MLLQACTTRWLVFRGKKSLIQSWISKIRFYRTSANLCSRCWKTSDLLDLIFTSTMGFYLHWLKVMTRMSIRPIGAARSLTKSFKTTSRPIRRTCSLKRGWPSTHTYRLWSPKSSNNVHTKCLRNCSIRYLSSIQTSSTKSISRSCLSSERVSWVMRRWLSIKTISGRPKSTSWR